MTKSPIKIAFSVETNGVKAGYSRVLFFKLNPDGSAFVDDIYEALSTDHALAVYSDNHEGDFPDAVLCEAGTEGAEPFGKYNYAVRKRVGERYLSETAANVNETRRADQDRSRKVYLQERKAALQAELAKIEEELAQ